MFRRLKRRFVHSDVNLEINDKAKMVVIKKKNFSVNPSWRTELGLLTAGTSDIPVAEEAKIVAQEMGCTVYSTYDVGVAGIHRLLEPLKEVLSKMLMLLLLLLGGKVLWLQWFPG